MHEVGLGQPPRPLQLRGPVGKRMRAGYHAYSAPEAEGRPQVLHRPSGKTVWVPRRGAAS